MPVEFKLEFLKKLRTFHRYFYAVIMVLFFVLFAAKYISWHVQTIYFILMFLIFWLVDELIFYAKNHVNPAPFQIRLVAYSLVMLVGRHIADTSIPVACVLFIYVFLLMTEEIFFSDVFSDTNSMFLCILMSLISTAIVVPFKAKISAAYVLVIILTFIICLLTYYLVYLLYSQSIKNFDDRYTKLYFKNADTVEENLKLGEFQQKVEKVNSEINLQKLNLTKANDELQKINTETRSLIEVMKYFSSNFNVPLNAKQMISNVMEIKKTSMCGFYMEKDTYMNEAPYLEILSVSSTPKMILEQDILDIYNMIKRKKIPEPLVICKNNDFKYPYLAGADICNAVAFPAFENDKVYGVMVVTSSKYDFFDGGFAFYETSIMNFTAALISDRLYLQTEDMAKKDGLTHIYNRIYFNNFYPKLYNEVLAENGELTVAMMDIDHFKSVNDTYGHLAGDEVIKMVASIDQEFAKKYGGTAVRFGGEEFLLILPNTSLEKAYRILCEMHAKIKNTEVNFEDLVINVNTSMGLASFKETTDDIHAVIEDADSAMYYSKEHGRGRITISGKEGQDIDW